jgi:REP element-mobilizing transposase RayT
VSSMRTCPGHARTRRGRRGGVGAEPRELNGQDDHVHLLVQYPSKAAVPALLNSLKGAPAQRIRSEARPGEPAYHARALPVAVRLRRILRWCAA